LSWRFVVCPQCGERFRWPIFTERYMGYGFTFYPLGRMTCPKCGFKDRSTKFKRANGSSSQPPDGVKKSAKPKKQDDTQSKKLDESKYEEAD
jgi:hypothetical protein